jgi:D-mannonate dehydratase
MTEYSHTCFVVVAAGEPIIEGYSPTDEDLKTLKEMIERTGLVAHIITDRSLASKIKLHLIERLLGEMNSGQE